MGTEKVKVCKLRRWLPIAGFHIHGRLQTSTETDLIVM